MRQVQNYVDEGLFRLLLEFEVQKAIRLRYSVSVVCLMPDFAAGTGDAALIQQIAQTTLRVIRATDVAAALSVDSTRCLGLLLIDAETRTLSQILNRVTQPQVLPEEGRLSWSAGGSCYPQTVTSGRELLHQATDLMIRARAEGGNRLYLPS